jgi:hypothetical protein
MNFNTPGELNDKLNQLFNGLIALPLLLVAYGYLEIYSGGYTGVVSLESNSVLIGAVVVLVLVTAYLMRQFRQQLKRINQDLTLEDRAMEYFLISRQYYLYCFVLAIIETALLYVFGEIAFAGTYAFNLFVLSVNRPGIGTMANYLSLGGKTRKDFINRVEFDKIDK